MKNFKVSELCSAHFTKESFVKERDPEFKALLGLQVEKCKKKLKDNAVPTIFQAFIQPNLSPLCRLLIPMHSRKKDDKLPEK